MIRKDRGRTGKGEGHRLPTEPTGSVVCDTGEPAVTVDSISSPNPTPQPCPKLLSLVVITSNPICKRNHTPREGKRFLPEVWLCLENERCYRKRRWINKDMEGETILFGRRYTVVQALKRLRQEACRKVQGQPGIQNETLFGKTKV